MQQFMQVSSMFPKFFDYDVYGMKVYIVQVEQLVDRLQTFMFRAKITDDPAAKQILNNINVQLMAAGQVCTRRIFVHGFGTTYRQIV